jgi:hypothetical protein
LPLEIKKQILTIDVIDQRDKRVFESVIQEVMTLARQIGKSRDYDWPNDLTRNELRNIVHWSSSGLFLYQPA